MSSPFNPREVEVLAAALPPEAVNPIGRLARSVLVLHAKRLTPGNYSQIIGTGPAFRSIFFPNAAQSPYEALITPLTGLDDGFFAAVSVALLCRQMANVTSRLRPQLLAQKADDDLRLYTARLRENSYRFYAEMTKHADSPIRAALAAFPDAPSRELARRHYLAGLTSPTWANDKELQWRTGNWPDREWELFNHYAKLAALGCTAAEIDEAINRIEARGLPLPPSMLAGAWQRQAPWLGTDLRGEDVQDATTAMLKTTCHVYPGSPLPSCIDEDNSYEFTARTQPGNGYRQLPASSCFSPQTRIVMADGTLRAIEDVAIGDEVATPRGPSAVVLKPQPLLGTRVLRQFEGTSFSFAASHPFRCADGEAAYAAVEPEELARTVPTLGQFGIRPLRGAQLLRRAGDGSLQPFDAPRVHEVEAKPEHLYDLYLTVGADGRSEYFAGDENLQVLVSSEVPRFDAAPETTAVILHILAAAGPVMLAVLADVADESFADVLSVGLEGIARTLMPVIGPELAGNPRGAGLPTSADDVASAVRTFASSLTAAPNGYDRRTGILVDQFAARFAPQFQAALALPWRSFELVAADITDVLAVTLYSAELFRPGPPPKEATAELALHRGGARVSRHLGVRAGAPADRWYYSVDEVAYFPEWSEPEPDDQPWHLDIAITPGNARMSLPLPRDITHGFQDFRAPIRATDGTVVGQAEFDVRLLAIDAFAAELRGNRTRASGFAERLADLAADYITRQFAQTVSLLRFCTATTTDAPTKAP